MIIGIHQSGVDARLLVRPDPAYPRAQEAGLNIGTFYVRGRFDIKAIRSLRRELIEHQSDILHVFNNRAASVAVLASIGLPVKIIAYRGIVGNVSFFSPNSWLTYLNPKVKRVICVAEAIRQFFLDMRFCGQRLNPEKFVTIHKGHSLAWYQQPPCDLTQFGIPENAFVIIFTGRDRARKGIEVLIDAIDHLPKDMDVHLLLVGKMHRKELMAKISQSPCKSSIHLAGFRNDAPQIAAAGDVFVLPSLAREGLPRAVIEAMASGTPALVSDAGGNPELVEHGISGYIHPAGDSKSLRDAIIKLYKDQQLLNQMGFAAQQRIDQHFDTRQTVQKTIDLYEQVLQEP